MLVGPTGCGLCGVDSLKEASHPPARVGDGLSITAPQVREALAGLVGAQALGAATRAVHAAGWWTRAGGLVLLREDVGRHNAVDKVIGWALENGRIPAAGSVLLVSEVEFVS